ncbi:MAG: metallophosphoesterase [Lachnospiraceae bacterium]
MGIIIAVILVIIAVCLIEVYYELHHFEVNTYQIPTSKVQNPLRYVVLSDLHNKQYGANNTLLLSEIEALNPDVVLLAGDMFTAHKDTCYQDTISFLETLSNKFPTYLGYGNHETRIALYKEKFPDLHDAVFTSFSTSKIRVLSNQSESIEGTNITVNGLEIAHSFYGRMQEKELPSGYIEKELGILDTSRFNILIAHNPIYFDAYIAYGADLIVSGHVHGGIIKIPMLGGVISPSLKFFPHYDGGEFVKGNARMILSRGIGNHTIPLRFLNKAELIVLDIIPE